MRMLVQHTVVLLAAIAASHGWLARAGDDVSFADDGGALKAAAGEDNVAAPADQACNWCDQGACCEEPWWGGFFGGGGAYGGCDDYPERGIVGFAGLDSFKGISDGSYQGNFGAVAGLNSAVPLNSDYGVNWQIGMSYGLYDFDGRTYTERHSADSQQQVFVTTGFFHKAECGRHLSFGMVYDWMFNNQWGVFGTAPTLGQWRGQVEYAVTESDAFGIWGCVRDLGSRQTYRAEQFESVIETRGISQVNFFWHHKFDAGASSWLWLGFPETERLGGDASLGALTLGANVEVPLSERLALYGNGSYFHPSAAAGNVAAVESGYEVGMGIVWYFGGHAVSESINGACGLPYMSVANNSTFLVDQHPTYYP